MSKKVITMDISTGQKKMDTIIDDIQNAKGKDDVAYSAKAIDELMKDLSVQISTSEW